MDTASADTVRRALRLLENSRKSARDYYSRNAEAIKKRSADYWALHRSALNEKRRERYAATRKARVPVPVADRDENDFIRHE